MKKEERYIYIVIITVLIGALSCISVYNFTNSKETIEDCDKSENENFSTGNLVEDGVKFIGIKDTGDKIVEEFEVNLNGTTNTLKIDFSYNFEEDEYYDGEYQEVSGKFDDNIVYSIAGHNDALYIKQSFYNINMLKTTFNESNFRIIKGRDDKNYLLLITNNQSAMHYPTTNYMYIYNDNLKLIDKLIVRSGAVGWELEGDAYPWYADEFKVCGDQNICHIRAKIENDKIYYLDAVQSNGKYVSVEEKVYTINNDKLEYSTINTYKISGPAYGQAD